MVSFVEGLVAVGLLILSFILGFITKTVLPFEYKTLRSRSIESQKNVKEWNKKTREILQEVRVLASNLRKDRSVDLESKNEEITDLQKRLAKHASKAPEEVNDDFTEDLKELSAHVGSISFVYNEFLVNFPETIENLDQIPFESEYDSVNIGDDHSHLGRIVREMTKKALEDRVIPLIEEIENNLDNS